MDRMQCEQFAELVHALVRLELLDTDLRERAYAHARICSSCVVLLEEAQTLAETSEALRESSVDRQAPLRVEAALLTAFRERDIGSKVRSRSIGYLYIAAAACLLIAGLIGYAKWSHTTTQRSESARSADAVRNGVAADVAVDVNSQAGVALPEAGSDSPADADQMANFVPVPFADESTPDDPGVIVRVQVTRAALGKLGYQVERGKGKELVNADFLVGEDGWPRAVRLEQ